MSDGKKVRHPHTLLAVAASLIAGVILGWWTTTQLFAAFLLELALVIAVPFLLGIARPRYSTILVALTFNAALAITVTYVTHIRLQSGRPAQMGSVEEAAYCNLFLAAVYVLISFVCVPVILFFKVAKSHASEKSQHEDGDSSLADQE